MEEKLPHIAIITVNAIVNQQLPNGQFHPKAVHSDSFSMKIFADSEEECIHKLKERLELIKDQTQE